MKKNARYRRRPSARKKKKPSRGKTARWMFRLATFTVVAAFCWSQCLVNQWGWKEGPETVGPIRERSTGQPDSESSRERPVNPESMASPALPSASGNRAAAPVVNSVESESDLKRHSTESSAYGLEIPAVDQPEFLVVCPEGRYTLWYDTLYRQAAWTAHVLTRADMETSRAERKNGFVICQTVRSKGWPYAKSSDYTRSGYDRGHLVPSADRTGSRTENDATFRLSNIAPQNPRLNRVLWNQLKAEIRQMALRLDTLWVVTGGELKPGLERIGASGVGVPEHFFKVLLARKKGEWMAMAFLVPNRSELKPSFWEYALSVAEAERLLGIDFFIPYQRLSNGASNRSAIRSGGNKLIGHIRFTAAGGNECLTHEQTNNTFSEKNPFGHLYSRNDCGHCDLAGLVVPQ